MNTNNESESKLMKSKRIVITISEEWDEHKVEKPFIISHYGPGNAPVLIQGQLNSEDLLIDSQQLAELGVLYLALAGNDVDLSSVTELLDNYNLPIPNVLKGKLGC